MYSKWKLIIVRERTGLSFCKRMGYSEMWSIRQLKWVQTDDHDVYSERKNTVQLISSGIRRREMKPKTLHKVLKCNTLVTNKSIWW